MAPELGDLAAALPPDVNQESPLTVAALHDLLGKLAQRPVPTGRITRLWALGSLEAKVAAGYLACWIRSAYATRDEKERQFNEAHLKAALKLLGGMGYLRGAIMKVGQILATHPDVVPEQFADVLGRLHFEAPPMHFALLREFVRGELGADPEDVFDDFETQAFAAASLGQVHRARIRGSGQRVAVKIQYPNIGRAIRDDFSNMLTFLMPLRLSGDWENLREQFDDVRDMLTRETDYSQESENLRIARSAFTEDDGIVVPRVFPEVSTPRVLTMELLEGPHLDEFLATGPAQQLRDHFGHKICVAMLRLDHAKSLVYADPQPGNFMFMPDGQLGFIDFGCCRHESEEDNALWAEGERAYFESRESLYESIARLSDLTPKQAADKERMEAMARFSDWAWEPVIHEGPFDFGRPEYFRRGVEVYTALLRRRYTRSRPANTWMIKAIYGLRAMLTRLEARVDVGTVYRTERKRGPRYRES